MTRADVTVNGRRLAVLVRAGDGPTVVWLGGFRSDMTATKASALDAWAARTGRRFVRFDYAGHGASEGVFAALGVSDWRADALGVIAAAAPDGPLILVGSSMGGHIALLVAEALAARVAGLVLIAPAPDFTERLMWEAFPPDLRRRIVEDGVILRPSAYSEAPTPISRHLIEDGRRHLVLKRGIGFEGPVRILHGTADADVPWSLSVELLGALERAQATLTLIKDGDHRLSTPADLALLVEAVEALA